jgi:hypothetical protein
LSLRLTFYLTSEDFDWKAVKVLKSIMGCKNNKALNQDYAYKKT